MQPKHIIGREIPRGVSMSVDYSRQHMLGDLAVPGAITVIGTGAVGTWLTYLAGLGGTKQIRLYTIGNVKPTDLARCPFALEMLGKPYALAIPEIVLALRPDIEFKIDGKFTPGKDPLDGVVFNCAASEDRDFDRRLYKQCEESGLKYYSGYYVKHTTMVVDYFDDSLAPASLEPLPAWAGSAALAGLQVLYAASTEHDSPLNRQVSLTSEIEPPLSFSSVGDRAGR
jgi:hypothetical protein